jgi:meiotic recombination protein DMC1
MQKEKKGKTNKPKDEEVNEGDNLDKTYVSIDELQDHGINVADITKLKNAGICTVKGLLMVTKKEICNIKGISDQKWEKMVEMAQKIECLTFINGMEHLQKRQTIRKISTGSQAFDDLLLGGIESQAITEVYGEYRTGKTQLAHTLCVTAQFTGGGGKVIYIDTENTFRPERIKQIAERFDKDGDEILGNIMVARAYTVDHLNTLLLHSAKQMYVEEFSLMVVDSIMAPFRVDYSGRGELSERQQVLGRTLSKLIKIAEQFNIAVLICNQVQSDPGNTMGGDIKKPIGGNIIAHASTTRLQLKKGKGELRICKMIDSPLLPEGECMYIITKGGIADGGE